MSGLFLKDLYTLKKYALWYAVYCVVFTLLAIVLENTAFVSGLAMLLPMSVTAAVVTCDRKDNWVEYSLACGVSPLTAAAEKMLLALAFAALGIALWPLAYFVTFPETTDLSGFTLTVALALAATAFSVPMSYKLGPERARLVMGIAALVLLIACVSLMTLFGNDLPAHPALLIAPPVVCAAACVPSLFITGNIIKNL